MFTPLDIYEAVRDFLEAGGLVVQILMGIAAFLWALILERELYFRTEMPGRLKGLEAHWDERSDHSSWYAKKIKARLVSMATREIRGSLPVIKVVVALCPLVGLLGTVTGMIQVFDVMAAIGTGNARAMAAGITRATLPTMAGMVIALSGIYFITRFENVLNQETHKLNDHMVTH